MKKLLLFVLPLVVLVACSKDEPETYIDPQDNCVEEIETRADSQYIRISYVAECGDVHYVAAGENLRRGIEYTFTIVGLNYFIQSEWDIQRTLLSGEPPLGRIQKPHPPHILDFSTGLPLYGECAEVNGNKIKFYCTGNYKFSKMVKSFWIDPVSGIVFYNDRTEEITKYIN